MASFTFITKKLYISISMRQLRSKKAQCSAETSRSRPTPKAAKKLKLEPLSRTQLRWRIRKRFQKWRMARVWQPKEISARLMGACLQREELACMICLELMLQPTTLRCGHSFCLHCVQNQSNAEPSLRCALCRAPDESHFHEPNHFVERMTAVKLLQMGREERREYRRREEDPLQYQSRVARRLEAGEEVKVRVRRIRVGESWKPGKVTAVLEARGRYFYEVEILGSDDRHLLPAATVNLSHSDPVPQRSALPFYFPTSALVDGLQMPAARPYNIDELLWEVNYYAPAATNWWNFEPDPIQELDSQSVLYLGRNPPPRHEIIEID